VEDRVVHQAARPIIEPIFQADFQEFSYGYWSVSKASLAAYEWFNHGLTEVVEIDVESFFDHVNHHHLEAFLMERIVDGYVIKTINKFVPCSDGLGL
jgi:retron-type reverse transcriptase